MFPNIIQNDVNHDKINIPAHWELSDSHNKNIQGFVKAHYMKLQSLNRKKDIKGVVANAMNDLKQIDFTNQSKGIYFVTLKNGNKTKQRKLIIQ